MVNWMLRAVTLMLLCAATRVDAATLFTDNFNGTAYRWTPSSGIWSVCLPPAASSYRYCQSDPNFTPPMSFAGDLTWADYSVQVTANLNDDVKGRVAVLGRVRDKYHFYELRLEKDSTGVKRWWIYKCVSNTFTALASGPYEYQRWTDYVLQLTMVDATLTASISSDGGITFLTLGRATDAQYRVGKIGLKTKSTAASFDSVTVLSLPSKMPPNTHRFGHVVLMTLENHSIDQVMGSPYLPYFNGLASQYGLARNFWANIHSSQPNYFVWTTGRFFMQMTPIPSGTNNVVKALTNAGKSWRAYYDDATSNVNVFQYLPEVVSNPAQLAKVVPITPNFLNDVRANTLPRYSIIHGLMTDNGHSCRGVQPCLMNVDNWLLTHMGPYIASPGFTANHDLLIIAWDEGDLLDNACSTGPTTILMTPDIAKAGGWTCGGHTVFLVISPDAKPGYVSTTIFHDEAILRVMLEGLGITTNLPGAAAFAPNMNEFFR